MVCRDTEIRHHLLLRRNLARLNCRRDRPLEQAATRLRKRFDVVSPLALIPYCGCGAANIVFQLACKIHVILPSRRLRFLNHCLQPFKTVGELLRYQIRVRTVLRHAKEVEERQSIAGRHHSEPFAGGSLLHASQERSSHCLSLIFSRILSCKFVLQEPANQVRNAWDLEIASSDE